MVTLTLKRHYDTPHQRAKLREELTNFTQLEGETMQCYADRFDSVMSEAGATADDQDMIDSFISSVMNHRVQDKLTIAKLFQPAGSVSVTSLGILAIAAESIHALNDRKRLKRKKAEGGKEDTSNPSKKPKLQCDNCSPYMFNHSTANCSRGLNNPHPSNRQEKRNSDREITRNNGGAKPSDIKVHFTTIEEQEDDNDELWGETPHSIFNEIMQSNYYPVLKCNNKLMDVDCLMGKVTTVGPNEPSRNDPIVAPCELNGNKIFCQIAP